MNAKTALPVPVAVKEFTAELVREYSAVPNVTPLGVMHHRMELHRSPGVYGDCIVWNWGRSAPDSGEQVIGLGFDGMKVVDYDGVFSLPREACQLLSSAGFDLSELGLDGEGREIEIAG